MNRRLLASACVTLFLGSVAHAGLLSYTLSGGTGSGHVTLGGVTTNFSNASFTYSATADSSQSLSVVSADGGLQVYYNPVTSVTITMTVGSSVTTLTTSAQDVLVSNGTTRSLPLAVVSFRDPQGSYSALGFAVYDTTPSVDSPSNSAATPFFGALVQCLELSSGAFTDLRTTGSFATSYFMGVSTAQVSGGGQSGVLAFDSFAGGATLTVAAVPGPGGLALLGAFAGVAAPGRRRRQA